MEHGHRLLIEALQERRPQWLGRPGVRMLEVGTTREPLPQQDSTRILAAFCQENGWDFVTCDMDPDNSARARVLFREMGTQFRAVTDKGEDYIARQRRAFDVVYLDAYDFDHGQHSETRQERYQQLLGSRIDQRECEVMHLKAMQGLNHAGREECLVVIDDTWQSSRDGTLQGKGPLAVPWAVRNGWRWEYRPPGYRAVVLELEPGYYALNRRVGRVLNRMRRRVRHAWGSTRPAAARSR